MTNKTKVTTEKECTCSTYDVLCDSLNRKIEADYNVYLLQLSAFGRLKCAFEMLCDLLNQNENVNEKNPYFLNFDTTVIAYEMLITNYIFVLIGVNKSTDKISLFNEQEFQSEVENFKIDNELDYTTLLNLRKKFFAHIDKVLLQSPQINMFFVKKCIYFINHLMHKKINKYGFVKKDK